MMQAQSLILACGYIAHAREWSSRRAAGLGELTLRARDSGLHRLELGGILRAGLELGVREPLEQLRKQPGIVA